MNVGHLYDIAYAADKLEMYLDFNAGTTADFPIRVQADCKKSKDRLVLLLNKLATALKPYRESKCQSSS